MPDKFVFNRSLDDVQDVMNHAKLDQKDLISQSQIIYFSSTDSNCEDHKLFEVDKKTADLIEAGEALIFRGESIDNAVLCSEDTTFEVKEAETSNSMLLLDDLYYPSSIVDKNLRFVEVTDVFHTYYEIKQIKPKVLGKLSELLGKQIYSGGSNVSSCILSLEFLLDKIPCSRLELLQALLELDGVCKVTTADANGWCLISMDYRMKILSEFFNLIEENAWSFENVDKKQTVQILGHSEPREIVEQIFDNFFETKMNSSAFAVARYDVVYRFFGEYLLQTGTTFNLEEFMLMWQQAMPEDLVAAVEMDALKLLRGLALIGQDTVDPLREDELPSDISQRLNRLFSIRDKWTLSEIEPYVEKLSTPQLNVNVLLFKHARAFSIGDVKYFTSKYKK